MWEGVGGCGRVVAPDRDMVCGMLFMVVNISHGLSGQLGALAE